MFSLIENDNFHTDFYFVSDSSEVINLLFFFFLFFIFITILLKSSDFNDFNHISWQNVWFTSQKWYDEIIYRKCIRFPDLFPDFSGFSQNLLISVILTIFFDRMFVLLLKNEIMKLFFVNVSGFRIFPGFSPDFPKTFIFQWF